jgi:hypothetical protein
MAEPSAPPISSTAFEQVVSALNKASVLPSLVLFKVEGILWNSASPETEAAPFPDAAGILAALRFKGIRVGVSLGTSNEKTFLAKICAESFQPTVSTGSCAASVL